MSPIASDRQRQACPRQRRRAASALEFAVVAVVFFPMVLAIFEVGRGLNVVHVVNVASCRGARVGIVPNTSSDAIRTAVKNIGNGAGLALTDQDVTVLVNEQSVDASSAVTGDEITVKVTVPAGRITWVPGGQYLVGNVSGQYTLVRE
jgi:Flp pilus assembly protein TadG